MQRVRVLWLLQEDLPVNLLGLLQLSGSVVFYRQIEGLLNGQLRHVGKYPAGTLLSQDGESIRH